MFRCILTAFNLRVGKKLIVCKQPPKQSNPACTHAFQRASRQEAHFLIPPGKFFGSEVYSIPGATLPALGSLFF